MPEQEEQEAGVLKHRVPDIVKVGSAVFSIATAAWTLTDLSGVSPLRLGMTALAKAMNDGKKVHGYVSSECGLNVRTGPGKENAVIGILPIGTEVEGIETEGWIELEDGFINADHVQEECPIELIGNWRVTAYASTGDPCANGEYPEVGFSIANNTLPFGTKVYIEDVGVRTVEDRGPAAMGSEWCDLYLGNEQTCIQWGDQIKKVWLVK